MGGLPADPRFDPFQKRLGVSKLSVMFESRLICVDFVQSERAGLILDVKDIELYAIGLCRNAFLRILLDRLLKVVDSLFNHVELHDQPEPRHVSLPFTFRVVLDVDARRWFG